MKDQNQAKEDAALCAAVTSLFLERNATQLKKLVESVRKQRS